MRKVKFSKEVKLKAIMDYYDGNKSMNQIAYDIGCDIKSFRIWIYNYKKVLIRNLV